MASGNRGRTLSPPTRSPIPRQLPALTLSESNDKLPLPRTGGASTTSPGASAVSLPKGKNPFLATPTTGSIVFGGGALPDLPRAIAPRTLSPLPPNPSASPGGRSLSPSTASGRESPVSNRSSPGNRGSPARAPRSSSHESPSTNKRAPRTAMDLPILLTPPPENGQRSATAQSPLAALVSSDTSDGDQSGRRSTRKRKHKYTLFGFRSHKDINEILRPRLILSPEFEAHVEKNLESLRQRNKSSHIQGVLVRHKAAEQDLLDQKIQQGERLDAKLEEARQVREKLRVDPRYQQNMADNELRCGTWSAHILTTKFAFALHERLVVHNALHTLRKWLPPIVHRILKVKQRRRASMAYTKSRMDWNPRPTPNMLQDMQGNFFKDWSWQELQNLCDSAEPKSFEADSYIMFDGDFDRVMYLLVNGTVEIRIRSKTSKVKQRVASNCTAKIKVAAPAYFGEFALLCKEPRSASIYCLEKCDAWIITHEHFYPQLQHLSKEIQRRLNAATDQRRKDNLKRFFPMRVEMMRKIPIFEHWSPELLAQISSAASPVVLRPNSVIYREGDAESFLYVLTDGVVKLLAPKRHAAVASDPSGSPSHYPTRAHSPQRQHRRSLEGTPVQQYDTYIKNAGECFGEFEAFFSHQQRRVTAVTETSCDLWQIHHDKLLDIGLLDASAMLESRRMIQQVRASRLLRPVALPAFISNDPFMIYAVPHSVLTAAWAGAKADVLCASEMVIKEGEDASQLVAIVSGTVHIRYGAKEWAEHSDAIEVDPIRGLRCRKGAESGTPVVGVNGQLLQHNIQVMFPHLAHLYSGESTSPSVQPPQAVTASDSGEFQPGQLPPHGHGGRRRQSVSHPTFAPGAVGLLFGAYELASRKNRYHYTVRCLSTVEIWRIDRSAVESKLNSHCRGLLDSSDSVFHVTGCFNSKNILRVLEDGVTRPSGSMKRQPMGQTSGQKDSAKRTSPGPGGKGRTSPIATRAATSMAMQSTSTTEGGGIPVRSTETPVDDSRRRRSTSSVR